MESSLMGDLAYRVISGQPMGSHSAIIFNQLFSFWKDGWGSTFKEDGFASTGDPSYFLRKDLVAGIFSGSIPIAFHAYTLFDLNLSRHRLHPFFKVFSEKSMEHLSHLEPPVAMSMEYLYVDPEWRKSNVGVSFASIIIQLGLGIFLSSRASVAVGVSRNNRNRNSAVYRKGATPLDTDVPLYEGTVDPFEFRRSELRLDLNERELPILDVLLKSHFPFNYENHFQRGEGSDDELAV